MTFETLEGWWTDAGTFESLLRASNLVAKTGAKQDEDPGGKCIVVSEPCPGLCNRLWSVCLNVQSEIVCAAKLRKDAVARNCLCSGLAD